MTPHRTLFKSQKPELKPINREDQCGGVELLVLHFKAGNLFPRNSGSQRPSCPARRELGRLEVLPVSPQGVSPRGVGCLVFPCANPPGGIIRGFRD